MGMELSDLRPIIIFGATEALLLGVTMIFIRLKQKVFPGFDFWIAGNFLLFMALIILGLRGSISDLISIIGGNLLLISATISFLDGIRRFRRPQTRPWIEYAFLLLAVFIVIYNYISNANINLRTILFSGLVSIISLITAISLVLWSPKEYRISSYFTATFAGALSILMAARAIVLSYAPLHSSMFEYTPVQLYVFLGITAIIIGLNFGLWLMTNERLFAEFNSTQVELYRLSTVDYLTQIYNIRQFYDVFQRAFASAQRYSQALGLVILDIDRFKSINDTYGHQTGDHALHEFAQLLKNIVRSTDILARYGGEEFIIALPNASLEACTETAERLRKNIETARLTGFPELRITASFGVTSIRANDTRIDDMISRADIALYEAKEGGRNMVVVKD